MIKGIILFFIQVVLTVIAVLNLRSIALADYLWIVITEALIAVLGFLTVKEISIKENRIAKLIGFTLGSIVGSLLGVYLSKMVMKE